MSTTRDEYQRREPTAEENALAHQVIGAAIEVHRILGPGFLESVYEEALAIELTDRSIPFNRQVCIFINYKDHPVGESRIDILVGDSMIIELKAVESLAPIHTAQVISYLKTTGYRLGLLINFNSTVLKDGIKRIVLILILILVFLCVLCVFAVQFFF